MAVFVRRAEFDDQPSINALIGEEAHVIGKRYGDFDVTNMIENASLGITAVDEKGTVIGYAAFFDGPLLTEASRREDTVTPELSLATWPKWLHRIFGKTEVTAANTVWMAFFIADHLVENEVAENILRTAFTTLPHVDTVMFALPEGARIFSPLRESFELLPCLQPDATTLSVYSCPRGLFLPELVIREARVEDHDDLVPVFNAQSEVLTERYGEFFIAELIGAQDEKNKALVAEVDGHAIGLMSTSSEIDVALLQQCFDLQPFGNLVNVIEPSPAPVLSVPAAVEPIKGFEDIVSREAEIQAEPEDAGPAPALLDAPTGGEAEGGLVASEAEEVEGAAESGEGKEGCAPASEAAPAEASPEAPVDAPVLETESNAFCISVFCMDESFESRASDFLALAFALYPEKEYAIVTLPHTTHEFSLLNSFIQVEPQPASSFGHLLYVFHRNALGGVASIDVRYANALDSKAIEELTRPLRERDEVLSAFASATGPIAEAAEGTARQMSAFVVEVAAQPVGLVLLHQDCDVPQLISQYSLEDFILFSEHKPENHAMVHTFVLNPIFSPFSRYVLKEVFRQHGKSCLYYQLQPGSAIPAVLSEFVQIRPRRQVITSTALDTELAEQREQLGLPLKEKPPLASSLYFLTRKLISEPKICNNSRIVVVGASDAALSLLESLISVPYLNFNYLYLVAPRAAERLKQPRGVSTSDAPSFFARSCMYTTEELAGLALGARVRVVESRVVDIDRSAKTVVLPDDSILPYDHLVIAPDLADQSLLPLGTMLRGTRGYFSLADEEAVASALAYMSSEPAALRGTLVVYGASLHAFATVAALLGRGVPAQQVLMVQPPKGLGEAETCFFDPRIAAKVHTHLAKTGVAVQCDLQLAGLEFADGSRLSGCRFERDGDSSVQQCAVLLCSGTPQVERATFEALNSNSLVYDAGLVVDETFKTNDASVYATGDIIKFARRCRAPLKISLCSPREAGSKLAQALMPTLDPLAGPAADSMLTSAPTFSWPRMEAAVLPGGLHFLHILSPLAGVDGHAALLSHPTFGRELVTGEASPDDFCALRLDRLGVVRSFIYLGPELVEEQNIASIMGLPESALNNLAARYDEGVIPSLHAFLRQNWAMALYHDRFGEFLAALRQELDEDDDFKKVMEHVRANPEMADLKKPADFVAELPEEKRKLVRSRLLDYVQANQNHLGMYLVPSSAIMKKMAEIKLK